MINQQMLQGNWNEIRAKLRAKWGQLTKDDLQRFDGNIDALLGLIQRKTGAGREAVESFLDEATSNSAAAVGTATETVRDYAQHAASAIQEGATHAADSLRDGYDAVQNGYEEAEQFVRRNPAEAAAICLGAGVLTGLVVSLLLTPARRIIHDETLPEKLTAQIRDLLKNNLPPSISRHLS